jgi:hypothetical protein
MQKFILRLSCHNALLRRRFRDAYHVYHDPALLSSLRSTRGAFAGLHERPIEEFGPVQPSNIDAGALQWLTLDPLTSSIVHRTRPPPTPDKY